MEDMEVQKAEQKGPVTEDDGDKVTVCSDNV